MKTFKTFLLSIVLLFLSINVSSQIVGQFSDWRDIADIKMLNNEMGESIDLEKTSGSPYLNPSFKKGIIHNLDTDEKLSVWLRYNVFSDNIEAKPELSDIEVAVVQRMKKYNFTLLGENFVLVQDKNVFEKKGSDNGYMAQISDSEKQVVIYKNYSHDFTPPVKAQTSYDVDTPGNLKIEFEYYYKNGDEPLKEITVHKRKIVNSFPENYQDDIKKFIKKKDFNLRGDDKEIESQLREIIYFFDSLLENI